MAKKEKYRVVMHKFIRYSETGSATYEITFNKSLEHTGMFRGIEDGLNTYVENERKQDFIKSIPNVYHFFKRWLNAR